MPTRDRAGESGGQRFACACNGKHDYDYYFLSLLLLLLIVLESGRQIVRDHLEMQSHLEVIS